MESVKEKVLNIILRRKGTTSRQLMIMCDGIGDPTRRCRDLASEGKITSEWAEKKIRGKKVRYKIFVGR